MSAVASGLSLSFDPPRPRFGPWVVAATVTMATFMEVLDTSIANVSLPHIAGNLAATQEESTWVLTSYLVSNAVVLPLSGWMSTLMGRKRFYMTCVLLFTLSSALCGMAHSLGMLVFFRVLQGVGGGGLQPSEQAILVDTFPGNRRGMAMAVYTIAILVAPVLGPTLGGWITDNFSWRWIFYINVPVGILSLTLSNIVLQDPPYLVAQRASQKGKPLRIDFTGLGLVALGLASLEIVLDKGQDEDWFSSHLIVTFAIVAVLALTFAVIWELKHPRPIINLRLLTERNFLTCGTVVFFVYGTLYGSTVLLPQMLQTLLGYDATRAGLVLSPAGLVTMLEMPLVGYLLGRRFDPRYMVAIGLAIAAFAAFWMSSLTLQVSANNVILPRIVQVLGAGLMFVPINTVAYRNIARDQVNNASGLFSLIRNEGASVGVATVTTLLQRHLQIHQSRLVERINPLNPLATDMIRRFGAGLSAANPSEARLRGLRAVYALVQQQAGILSYLDLFRLFGVATVLTIPLVFFMQRPSPGGSAAPAH